MGTRTRSKIGDGGEIVTENVAAEQGDEKEIKVELRADKSIRRAGPGTRSTSDMFSPEKLNKPMTRADYINTRSMEEYSRREMKPLRRLWRWLRNWPQVVDVNASMATAQARNLDEIRRALTKQLQEQDDAAQARSLAEYQESAKRRSGEKPKVTE